jgi:hypothetical protein
MRVMNYAWGPALIRGQIDLRAECRVTNAIQPALTVPRSMRKAREITLEM